MKLIIDISEATQKIIHDHGEVGIHMSAEKLLEAIQDSISLDDHDELVIATTVKSIWGKSYTDMLDKIRNEIERKANSGQWSDATIYGMLKAIAIIDKYKNEVNE